MSVIEINDISMHYRMASEQVPSLKEFIIRRIKNEISFKTFNALEGVSFSLDAGEVLGIIGINGAGKSTLLKIIAGVLEPTCGNIRVNGEVSPMLELGSGFDYELTALENIYLNGSLLGYSKSFIDKKLEYIINFAELHDFIHQKVKNFSSGMIARLAFAVATARENPDILILDEILSVGDMFFRQKSEEKMKELIKGGSTVLLVSHSLDTIVKNCTKTLWLEKGHVKMFGDTKEICEIYKNSNKK